MAPQTTDADPQKAAELLGVEMSASDEQLRSAYLKQLQLHPPDRDPEAFERIRDAYEQLRNPAVRAEAVLHGPDLDAPLSSILDGLPPRRAFVGTQLWMELLKEKRS